MKSEQINELAAALSKAQGQMEGAKKDTQNPFFKSKYADLASVWEAIRKPLSENGLSVVQGTSIRSFIPAESTIAMDFEADALILETTLLHASGQWITSITPVRAKDDSPQAMGSAITYARRYALAAIVGVYQEDDDANMAQKIQQTQVKPPTNVRPQQSTPSRPIGSHNNL